MDYDTWILFCLTELVLCFSPGPAVLYVLTQGISAGFKPSLAANGGIIFGNTVYFVISATGLGALLLASHNVFLAVKWLGTVYLIWLGIQLLRSKPYDLSVKKTARRQFIKVFQGATLIQLANPKNIVFFMAILPQFINLEYSLVRQILILGISSIVIEMLVLMFYGALGSKIESWTQNNFVRRFLNKLSGGALISIGLSLAFIQQAEIKP